jgi:phosphate-selective porin OprO/OprP
MKITKGRTSVLVGVLVVLATSAFAAEQKPVVEQLLEIMRENGQITADQHSDLLDQAKAEQQQAAEALLAAREAAEKAESSGGNVGLKVTTNYNGLQVKTTDGQFKFGVGGRIQTDFGIYDQDKQPLGDGIEIRRARLKAYGTLFEDWAYKIEANFETDRGADLTDAWIRYNGLKPFYVQVGHQKVPFSQQSMTSSNWQVFQERALQDALIDNPQTGRRRLGLTVGSNGDHWNLAAGIFGEGVDDAGASDESWGAAGRFVFAPIVEDTRVLTFGASAYYRDFRNDSPLRYAARPEAHTSGTKLIDTGDLMNVNEMMLYNAETSAVLGPFHAQAEYTGAHVGRKGDTDPEFHGFYVQAGYFLTGESRSYDIKSGKYKRIMPKRVFGDRSEGGFGLGAWEIAARYSWLDLDDNGVKGGRERDVTAALNWWINPSLLFRFNYVYANPDNNFAGQDEHVNIFEGRAQVVF